MGKNHLPKTNTEFALPFCPNAENWLQEYEFHFFPLRSPSTNLTKLTSKDLFVMRHQKSISKCLGDGLSQWLPVPSHVVSSR